VDPDDGSQLPAGVDQVLKGHEFSSLAVMAGPQGSAIFAGGIQGLFRIDPETLENKRGYGSRPGFPVGPGFTGD
jgi:hypothetical protein